jgi:ectoine hydroxylase-related dioxygenase (phytanoyl-CoA dioxygenase family)
VTSEATKKLDIEALARAFAEDGYVVVKGVVSPDKLAAFGESLVREFERVSAAKELFSGGGLIAGHLNCFPGEGARFVHEELGASGVMDLIRKISPTQADALRVGCNMNFPKSVAQNYHLDGNFNASFLVVNVAIVDTTLVNGAIDVIPKTHRRPYKYWEFAAGRVYRGSTRLPMQRGDVLIRKSTLWHRGMPNRSQAPRPMLAMTFGESSAPKGDPFREHDGKIVFETNRFNTNLLGQLRERSFVAMPLAHSALRFVRSLMGKDGYA